MYDNYKKRSADQPLSDSTIPTSLADIRRRCSDLLSDDSALNLSLEDGEPGDQAFNPYDRNG